MHLIQFLLPLYDPQGERFPHSQFAEVRAELTERFGGVTAWVQSPARGLWQEDDGSVARDDVALHEVMVESLDRTWWGEYRESLRRRFRQEELVLRALEVERL